MLKILRNHDKRTIMFLIVSFIALLMSFFRIGSLRLDAAWIAVILCGVPILMEASKGLWKEFDIKADVLVSLALIASIIIGEIFAAGEVAFIMTIGAYLEEHTAAKARAEIQRLVNLTPVTARVVREDQEIIIPAEQVNVGDTLRVIAGEIIAVDGTISNGQSTIDQSVMTGESMPVDKNIGDDVYSGTVNQYGTFEMKAVKALEDSSIQRMIHLIESADADKAKIVGTADKWATWIVIIALLSAAVTFFATGEIIRSVTILVVFCPCALVLATPTAIMAGIGNASKYGILIRQGDALERLAAIDRIAFDKTGTLTYGKPDVVAVKSCHMDYSEQDILQLAASAELRSEHPLGKAIITYYNNHQKNKAVWPEEFQLIPGRGVIAEVKGTCIYAGSAAMMKEYEIPFSVSESHISSAEKEDRKGRVRIYIGTKQSVIGIIELSDTVRPDSAQTIQAIHRTGLNTILLTGDENQAAKSIADMVGIKDMASNCMPQDKMQRIKEYQEKKQFVCMVGDGINDAPALKIAHVGIAMGGIGSDIAIEASDIALVGDDIKVIPHLLLLAKKTIRTIRFNLAASMILNFVAIVFAISGILTPVLGALVHNIGSVAVILHSSLLLKWKA